MLASQTNYCSVLRGPKEFVVENHACKLVTDRPDNHRTTFCGLLIFHNYPILVNKSQKSCRKNTTQSKLINICRTKTTESWIASPVSNGIKWKISYLSCWNSILRQSSGQNRIQTSVEPLVYIPSNLFMVKSHIVRNRYNQVPFIRQQPE